MQSDDSGSVSESDYRRNRVRSLTAIASIFPAPFSNYSNHSFLGVYRRTCE